MATVVNLGAPGYTTFGISFKEAANVTFNFSISRSCKVFFSPQVGGGVSLTGINGSLVGGWINGSGNGSGKAVDSFLQGNYSNIMVGAVAGGAVTGNGSQTSKEFGVMTPQTSFGLGYGIHLFSLPGVRW